MKATDIIGRHLVQDNLFTSDKDIFISKSPYSAFENKESDELVFKGRTDFVNPELIAMQVQKGYLRIKDEDTTDLSILLALDELEFASSRMITIYLNLTGIDIHQRKVQDRLTYMSRLKVLSSYEFVSKDKNGVQKRSHSSIYFLDAASIILLRSQDIWTSFKLETALKSKKGIKEVLARNQLMLKYVQDIKNINYTTNNPIYKLPSSEVYRPNLQIVFDHEGKNQHLFFEVARTFEGWEKKIIGKLERAKLFIENFETSNSIPQAPIIVIIAENDQHSFDIMKLIISLNLTPENYNYIFTTDGRTLTSQIDNSIFRFVVSDNKASIRTLNMTLFQRLVS